MWFEFFSKRCAFFLSKLLQKIKIKCTQTRVVEKLCSFCENVVHFQCKNSFDAKSICDKKFQHSNCPTFPRNSSFGCSLERSRRTSSPTPFHRMLPRPRYVQPKKVTWTIAIDWFRGAKEWPQNKFGHVWSKREDNEVKKTGKTTLFHYDRCRRRQTGFFSVVVLVSSPWFGGSKMGTLTLANLRWW